MANFRPFLTGSRAYGLPRPNSDVDLVLYLDEDDLTKLGIQADQVIDDAELEDMYGQAYTTSLRFGNLNLICCTDDMVFEAWRIITRELKQKAPVPRDFAVEYMAKRRAELLPQFSHPPQRSASPRPLHWDDRDANPPF
jgi:hypothetical protein